MEREYRGTCERCGMPVICREVAPVSASGMVAEKELARLREIEEAAKWLNDVVSLIRDNKKEIWWLYERDIKASMKLGGSPLDEWKETFKQARAELARLVGGEG